MELLPRGPLTDGVIALRAWHREDAAWYAAQTDDPDIQRFTGEPAHLDPVAVTAAVERMHAGRSHAGLAITDAVTGRLLGNAGLAPGKGPSSGELSYWVAATARGQGVATRAVALLVDWAWACDLSVLWLYTHVDNTGSQVAAARSGFERVGLPETRTVKGTPWTVVWYVLRRRPP